MRWSFRTAWLSMVVAMLGFVALPVAVAQAQTTELGLDRSTPSSFDRLTELEERIVDVVEDVRPAVVGLRMRGAGGSGTFISEDGYIATAAHVIRNRDQPVTVFLSDGSSYQGRTMGMNHDADYGIVRTDVGEAAVPYASMGDTFDAVEGQWVISMGHPLGTETEDDGYPQFRPPVVRVGRIHTIRNSSRAWHIVVDTPLISGDSGGPMFDLNGNLIAINVSIDVRNPRNNNGTWITPFVHNLDRMKENEIVEGVGIGEEAGPTISPQQFQEMNLEGIEYLDAERWAEAEQVFQRMLELDPGSLVAHYNLACTYSLWSESVEEPERTRLRGQAFDALRASIDNGWNDHAHMRDDEDLDPIREDFVYDALVRRMLDQEPYVGLTPRETEHGVEVVSVGENTAADEYDLRVGDVILRFGNHEIETRQNLINAAREMRPGDEVPLRLQRKGREVGLTMVMGGRERQGETVRDDPHRDSEAIRELVRSRGERAARSVVEIRVGERRIAFGAVIDADGLILVKNSMIQEYRDSLAVRLPSGQEVGGTRVAYDAQIDVALIRVSTTDLINRLHAVRFVEEDPSELGSLLFSVGTDAVPFAMGVRSLTSYLTQAQAFLGVGAEPAQRHDLEPLGLRGGVVVSEVVPNTGAEREGVQVGDLMYKVNDTDIHSLEDLRRLILDKSPGDTVDVHIYRHGEALTKRVTLGERAAPTAPANPMFDRVRGPANDVDRGFGEVIQHDGVVGPRQSGSLLIDREGNVVGFNIARSDRTRTFALPASVVQDALPALRHQAKQYEQRRTEDF